MIRVYSTLKQVLFLGVLWTALLGGCSKENNTPSNSIYGTPGPAGGIIFYDKGFYSDGWRYMEITAFNIAAHPATWGCKDVDLPMCNEIGIGKGLENTINIINAQDTAATCDTNPTAAKICVDYTLNGFSDWFLPSASELEYAVEALKPLGLGGFYHYLHMWSSTEDWHGSWNADYTVETFGRQAFYVLVDQLDTDNQAEYYYADKNFHFEEVRAVRRY